MAALAQHAGGLHPGRTAADHHRAAQHFGGLPKNCDWLIAVMRDDLTRLETPLF